MESGSKMNGIMNELQSFYTNLFKSERLKGETRIGFVDTLDCIQNQVSRDMNNRLVSTTTTYEV